MSKKSAPNLDEQLKQEYDRWEYLYTHGGQDPFYSDGCNLELVRNHIIYRKREMEQSGKLTDAYYRELPPEVDRNYMARADEIRENARKSLEIYKKHPDYLYLVDAIKLLNKRQIEETCISNIIWYVKGLEKYIENDDLIAMRRHEDPERYIDSFPKCREKVEKILGNKKPQIIFIEDEKQLKGQMNITNWLTA